MVTLANLFLILCSTLLDFNTGGNAFMSVLLKFGRLFL